MNQSFYQPQPVKEVDTPEVGQRVRLWWRDDLQDNLQPHITEGVITAVDPESKTFVIKTAPTTEEPDGVEFWTGRPFVTTIEVLE